MKLDPRKWFSGNATAKAAPPGATVVLRPTNGQGPWTGALGGWNAREVSPHLYEAMREACPPIDAAIDRLVTLDGILRIETESDRLRLAIEDWMDNVQVNDMQHGLQTFYAGQSNEMYEQGFTIGTYHLGADDVDRLRVLDSKGLFFQRGDNGKLQAWYSPPGQKTNTRHDGTENIERLLRNTHRTGTGVSQLLDQGGYRQLAADRMIYASRCPEADNPYGTSIMRSTEFMTRLLATIGNTQMQVWERFGSPSFQVTYKTKNRKLGPTELAARQQQLADNLSAAMTSKGNGNAADFVNAIGADDDLVIKVLGADGQVLEVEAPARHVLEQIVAKTGLPSWMLGFHWSTAERLAQRQGELALQESRTRYANRKPQLVRLISTALRARGITWNPGDWDLIQDLPNLQDLVAISQANFLDAQTELMRVNAGTTQGADMAARSVTLHTDGSVELGPVRKSADAADFKAQQAKRKRAWANGKQVFPMTTKAAEPAAENGRELDAAESAAVASLSGAWETLRGDAFAILGLTDADTGKAAKAPGDPFTFDPDTMLDALLALQDDFVTSVTEGQGSDYMAQLYAAWAVGVATAASQTDTAAMVGAARTTYLDALRAEGVQQVRNTTARAYADDIIAGMQDGLYNGENPADVARELRNRFDIHQYDWQRLARSEITQAHALGKVDQYAALDIAQYDYVTAGDGKVSSICRSLAANGPYVVGKGPLPMRDSHPNCRCTVVARIED